ncbi:MAG: NYN domain-containing protein [Actinomycetaceae bacterium]|nr:NYN domain-containing protein [Actinomycetaceae bacterium]
MEPITYLIIDGENIDTTLGVSVLDRKPLSEERPRWDRVLSSVAHLWDQHAKGLFFLNASSGYMPMNFVQALLAMSYTPIPLAGTPDTQIVDQGIKRTLDAIADRGYGDVILASHDGDYEPEIKRLLEAGHRVGILGFPEFISGDLHDLIDEGLEIIDMEHDIDAFQVRLPRLRIIDLDEFNPLDFL